MSKLRDFDWIGATLIVFDIHDWNDIDSNFVTDSLFGAIKFSSTKKFAVHEFAKAFTGTMLNITSKKQLTLIFVVDEQEKKVNIINILLSRL